MPEGDTIHYAANRIRAALVGEEIEEIATPHPRQRADRWPERLDGRAVRRVDAHGKHAPLMRESSQTGIRARSAEPSACGEGGGITTAPGGHWGVWVHERAGLPCRRCDTLIRGRGQGDDNRTTFWCPSCQG